MFKQQFWAGLYRASVFSVVVPLPAVCWLGGFTSKLSSAWRKDQLFLVDFFFVENKETCPGNCLEISLHLIGREVSRGRTEVLSSTEWS